MNSYMLFLFITKDRENSLIKSHLTWMHLLFMAAQRNNRTSCEIYQRKVLNVKVFNYARLLDWTKRLRAYNYTHNA